MKEVAEDVKPRRRHVVKRKTSNDPLKDTAQERGEGMTMLEYRRAKARERAQARGRAPDAQGGVS